MRKASLVALLITAAVVVPGRQAQAAIPFDIFCGAGSTGNELNQPGTYKLRNATADCLTDTAILITAPNIVVDLNGYVIDGNDSGDNGIFIGAAGVTVRNGTISDYEEGIEVDSNEATLTDLVIRSNGTGLFVSGNDAAIANNEITQNVIGIDGGPAMTIKNNTISGNANGTIDLANTTVKNNVVAGNTGIGIGAAHLNTISRNTIHGNGGRGIQALGVSNSISLNRSLGNGDTGIYAGDAAKLIGNTTRGNAGSGILMEDGGSAKDNISKGNRLDGIRAGQSNVLKANVANGNGNDGIEILVPDSTTTVAKNTANGNLGFGIDSGVGVIGTGTNKAKDNNGVGPQCDPVDLCV